MSTLNLSDDENAERAQQNKEYEIAYQTVAQAKSGASWFYWIAGLSLINSIIFLSGGNWGFFAGLGITQVIDAIVLEINKSAESSAMGIIAFVLDVIIAGIFILCGIWANKFQPWAFIVGMILYFLDGVLILILGAFLPAAFHAFALFMIARGFFAARQISAAQNAPVS